MNKIQRKTSIGNKQSKYEPLAKLIFLLGSF